MSKELKCEITELIGPVKENPKNNWCKYILKVSYNDKPANVDIRNIKFNEDGSQTFGKGISLNIKFNEDGSQTFGKGISLTDEECDTMVDMLVEKGYGSTDKLEDAVKRKKSIFGGSIFDDEEDDNSSKLVIKCGKD